VLSHSGVAVSDQDPEVFVIDEEPRMRRALERVLQRHFNVRTFETADEMLASVASLEALDSKVLLFDLGLSGTSGFDLLKMLRAQPSGGPKMLVFTEHGSREVVLPVMGLEPNGYVLKDDPILSFRMDDVVQEVVDGGFPMSSHVATILVAVAAEVAEERHRMH
jgi:DNA-binding NarL/FixJ family response regulator